MKKILLLVSLAVFFGLVSSPVFAAKPSNPVLVNNWFTYNRSSDFAKLWDNNKATALENGGVGFTFNQEVTTWYTAYFKAHYNGDLTDKTISANVSVTKDDAIFVSRLGGTPTVGIVIKSAEGNWGVNDYWWFNPRLTLSTLDASEDITASTSNLANWTNICGQPATSDDTSLSGTPDCVGGTYPDESPSEGFTNALKNVKEVGLSFGGSGYARGVALSSGTASFQLNSFMVTP